MADEDFLRRWARRKTEARQGGEPAPPPVPPTPTTTAATVAPARVAAPAASAAAPAPLPDPSQLEPGAEISAFMAKGVDDLLRRKALKSLFSDPHFNVMDRMDVYIDDYSIADPLPPDWLDKLEQVSHLGDKAGRDRAEAERQAALDAQLEGDGGAAETSQPLEALAPESPVQDAALGSAGSEPASGATPGHAATEKKPEPHE